jgi:hypothetical protein
MPVQHGQADTSSEQAGMAGQRQEAAQDGQHTAPPCRTAQAHGHIAGTPNHDMACRRQFAAMARSAACIPNASAVIVMGPVGRRPW